MTNVIVTFSRYLWHFLNLGVVMGMRDDVTGS